MPAPPDRPHVYTNFVASVDGIVAIDPPRGTGADVSGGDLHDRAVMGLLRAVADAVVIGGGNLRAEGDHVWTAERICPELAAPYAALRAALGKPAPPLQLIVTGRGDVDPVRAVFGGAAPHLVVTTTAGAAALKARGASLRTVVPPPGEGWIPLAGVLAAAGLGPGARVLVESGPTSTARFVAEGAIDELFLTRAPRLIGRSTAPPTLALLDGTLLPPDRRGATLLSVRRRASFLFLRYSLA